MSKFAPGHTHIGNVESSAQSGWGVSSRSSFCEDQGENCQRLVAAVRAGGRQEKIKAVWQFNFMILDGIMYKDT